MQQPAVFLRTLHRAAPALSGLWWVLLLLGGVLPAVFAVATGDLVDAAEGQRNLAWPLLFTGATFLLLQIVHPVHRVIGQNLGRLTADHMNDRLLRAALEPPGISHLEDPELQDELSMARDFDLGITAPPLFVSMGFIASGLQPIVAGLASAVVLIGFNWWAPLVLVAAWGSTHWLLAESGVWKDRNTDQVRQAQRHADYAYRLAVDAPAAKEVRLYGLADWVVARFAARRTQLYELQWQATRLRERSVLSSLALVIAANGVVFWALAAAVSSGRIGTGETVVYAMSAILVSAVAFGQIDWALDAASAPAAAVERLVSRFSGSRALEATDGADEPASAAHEIRFRGVDFTYPRGREPVLRDLDLHIAPGSNVAIVGRNGAGKTTLAKLLCRFYDPQSGTIEVDGRDLRTLDLDGWRRRTTAVFQDFVRYELTLRENVAPNGAPEEVVLQSLEDAGAAGLADLDTPLSKSYPGGTELSGGQWQRVALARAICGVRLGAGLVLLDEPTAQLDVRGEAEIFRRLLEATRECTTILVSHRFSTVRLVDRIVVLEDGRVAESGSHEELMARGGRYRSMYELQASRFVELDEHGQEVVHDRLD